MDEVAHHGSETDETNEPSDYEKDYEEIDYAVHDFGVFTATVRDHAAMGSSTKTALSDIDVWNMHPTVFTACVTLPQAIAHKTLRSCSLLDQSSFNTARNASCGTSTLPTWRIRFLPSFCFSSSLRLRLMSPP